MSPLTSVYRKVTEKEKATPLELLAWVITGRLPGWAGHYILSFLAASNRENYQLLAQGPLHSWRFSL